MGGVDVSAERRVMACACETSSGRGEAGRKALEEGREAIVRVVVESKVVGRNSWARWSVAMRLGSEVMALAMRNEEYSGLRRDGMVQ